jgi:hypothetical protein
MPQLSNLEKNYLRSSRDVALLDGRLYRGTGNAVIPVSSSLYSEVSPNEIMKWGIGAAAYTGNWSLSIYKGGTVTGGLPSLPLPLNLVNPKVYPGTVNIGLSSQGATWDDTGATLITELIVDESQNEKGGVVLNFPGIVLDPNDTYAFIVTNLHNADNSITWYTDHTVLTY